MPYLNNVSVKGPSPNDMTKLAKEITCSVVHTSCKKMLSNVAAIEHYETEMAGIQLCYERSKDHLEKSCPQARIPAPVKLQLNTHNIVDVQKAIIDAFRYDDENNVYGQMRKSPFWSLMHDGIAKFGQEYNGVCLRALDSENAPIATDDGRSDRH